MANYAIEKVEQLGGRVVETLVDAGIAHAPGKAANAGGVATIALELQQNASHDTWSCEHTERKRVGVQQTDFAHCGSVLRPHRIAFARVPFSLD